MAKLRLASTDTSYWCLHWVLHLRFHISFLVTHLPGQVHLCGLPAQVSANALALIGLANMAAVSEPAGWARGGG